MGSSQSVQAVEDEEDDEEESEKDDEEDEEEHSGRRDRGDTVNHLVKKVLEQEPEMLPCHASASPLSPQLSSLGTPRLGPSIKVWDPYNVLAPPPPPLLPPPPVFSRLPGPSVSEDQTVTEVFLISHGECELNLRPDLVGGRCHVVALTAKGKRQARALAVFLNSQGVRFNSVYSSPLDRARSTAVSVCQEMNFGEEDIQFSDDLSEMSLGDWEGCHRSEIYTPEVLALMERYQPDFSAPSGESLRHVEFRMIQFLNGTILRLPEKLRSDIAMSHNEAHTFSQNPHSAHDRDGSCLPSPNWDSLQRHRPVLSRKKSGKSRLQYMTSMGGHEADDEMSPREASHQIVSHCVGVFTHSLPIKCLLMGLLGCSPVMSHKICVEDSSMTVLQHSWKTGWQIKRMNDTAHLRLL